jgi:hypothetical protein
MSQLRISEAVTVQVHVSSCCGTMFTHVSNRLAIDVTGHRPRSGNKSSKPAREAGHVPRSVIKPVTSRAGVTSKA